MVKVWSRERESNPRPSDYKSGALPTALPRQRCQGHLVGLAGFEPTTFRSRSGRAAKLRYSPLPERASPVRHDMHAMFITAQPLVVVLNAWTVELRAARTHTGVSLVNREQAAVTVISRGCGR